MPSWKGVRGDEDVIVHTYPLDMVPLISDELVIKLSQYDADFTLVLKLRAIDADFVVESGTSVTLQGRKADGSRYTGSASLSNKIVTIAGNRQLTDVPGKNEFELCFKHNNKELHSTNFIIDIEPRPI